MSDSERGRYPGYQIDHGAAEQKPFYLVGPLPRPKQSPDDFGLGMTPCLVLPYGSADKMVGQPTQGRQTLAELAFANPGLT